jgi:hypothetical protein
MIKNIKTPKVIIIKILSKIKHENQKKIGRWPKNKKIDSSEKHIYIAEKQ